MRPLSGKELRISSGFLSHNRPEVCRSLRIIDKYVQATVGKFRDGFVAVLDANGVCHVHLHGAHAGFS